MSVGAIAYSSNAQGGSLGEFTPRRCRRCDILIYSSRDEAAAANSYWRERFHVNIITGRQNKRNAGDPMGARLIPHINGAVGDLCAACARETAGHKGLVSGRQIAIYSEYFGGELHPGDTADEPAGKDEETEMRRNELSDGDVIALHRQYVMDDRSTEEIGLQAGVSGASIGSWFRRLELPVRLRNGRWRVADVARICEVHDMQPDQVPGADKAIEPTKKVKRPAAVGAPTVRASALAPITEATPDTGPMHDPDKKPRPAAVVPARETAVAANSNGSSGDQAGDLREQLDLIQELLGLAEAKQVTLRGKISVELHAEVAF